MDMCRFLGGKHVHSDSFLCRDMWRAPFGLHLGKVRPSRTFPLSDAARHADFGAFPDGTGIQKTLQSPTFSYRILHLPYGKSKENSIKHALSYTFFMYPTPYPTPNPSPEIVSKYRASCALV